MTRQELLERLKRIDNRQNPQTTTSMLTLLIDDINKDGVRDIQESPAQKDMDTTVKTPFQEGRDQVMEILRLSERNLRLKEILAEKYGLSTFASSKDYPEAYWADYNLGYAKMALQYAGMRDHEIKALLSGLGGEPTPPNHKSQVRPGAEVQQQVQEALQLIFVKVFTEHGVSQKALVPAAAVVLPLMIAVGFTHEALFELWNKAMVEAIQQYNGGTRL